ncbi:VCBS repeat-containing protein [Actinoplanes sp. NEAU-A12]|uniref:VCBS repeat-containing protein n=1 Tax=Actinoplanes sandaracinus TaxID=3045177 RepID=A0ABT6WTF7_9ACTN|nr:VCBS repeat-containing protein [Actinoplanes sandaracinus]MDI6103028.1 VCBS repeat-containing protein [Actinoplanes sandaracinus]
MTTADRAVADRLRPSMNGPRLGRAVTGERITCARAIVRVVQARRLPQRAAVIAVTTVIAESTLLNHTVATDHDSLGLFQQRPSQGWGRPAQLVDPVYATGAFLNAMIRKHPGGAWMTGDIGQISQRVQKSAIPGAYAPEVHDAQLIVDALWTGGAPPADTAATEPAAPAPVAPAPAAPAPPTKPQGPFQRSLSTTYTGLAATDERHHLAMADWNGDGRADLAVVQGTDTATGRTEVRIMDGATRFQSLLLQTVTALGATDSRYEFSLADWNADARPDLVAVHKSGTASGRTELRILDGASAFRRVLLETATGLPAMENRQGFSLTDWNADGRLDLVAAQTSGTASQKTEVRVVDGASQFQRELGAPMVTSVAADGRHEMFAADFNADRRPDLVLVQTSATASGQTEVQVLDGASGLRSSLLQSSTAMGPMDHRHDLAVADWNGDGKQDLVVVQKSEAPSGRTEAAVLDGSA